jgi:hypothetical protein
LTMRAKTRKKLRQLLLFLAIIQAYNSVRVRTYLHRAALLHPSVSPWQWLYHNGDESSFLVMTGLSRHAFQELLLILFPNVNDQPMFGVKGRPKSLNSAGKLGLLMSYLCSMLGIKHLCMIFGITPSVCSREIFFMLRLVVRRLKKHPLARVKFPNEEKMHHFASLVQGREPQIHDVIGFMDGVALSTECSSEQVVQNAYYNGYHSDTMVNNIFAYGPDGKVFLAAINFPGSWHDGSITTNLMPYIKQWICGFKICVNQGFLRSGDANKVLVSSYSRRTAQRLACNLWPFLLRHSSIYTSLWQASE